MDSLTHIVLGACLGEATAGKSLGKKAMFWGALANSLPDADVIATLFLPTAQNLLAHRGPTHAFLFLALGALVFSAACARWVHRPTTWPTWLLLWGVNLFAHGFIDAFNAYGTGWWLPFNQHRVAFHALFVADPLFTVGPLVATIVLLLLRRTSAKRPACWKAGVGAAVVYLGWALACKTVVSDQLAAVQRQLGAHERLVTPSPFNTFLWFVALRTDSGFYTGYRSALDGRKPLQLQYHPRNDRLLQTVTDQEEAKEVLRFAEGWYTLEQWHDTTVLNVLRFGQIAGWQQPRNPFVFHYWLDRPGANLLVTQRGRFARWNDTTLHALWQRMWGR